MAESRLDALFRTTFQPARETDTWQGIRREDGSAGQRRKNPNAQKQESGEGDDLATLSVLALHEFLQGLLRQAGMSAAPVPARTLPEDERGQAGAEPSAAQVRQAHAAQAYQATARAAPGQSIDFSERIPSAAAASGPPVTLSAQEIADIKTLIAAVEVLGQRGIGAIALQPGDTFLQALRASVNLALGL